MSQNTQSINIAISESDRTQERAIRKSSLYNTTESAPKIDFSQKIKSKVKANSDDISEMSAPLSDVEPESTATALRTKTISHRQSFTLSQKVKRSYKTVDPVKRSELIRMVNLE